MGAEIAELRDEMRRGAIAAREQDAFAAEFVGKFVDEFCGGAATANVSNIETGQPCRFRGGFANGGDVERLRRASEIPRCACLRWPARNDGRGGFFRTLQSGEAICDGCDGRFGWRK